MRQRLQRCAKPIFHPARPVRDTAQLTVFTAEKRHDPVRLPQWIRFQNNRVALKERHATFLVTRELIMPESIRATGNCHGNANFRCRWTRVEGNGERTILWRRDAQLNYPADALPSEVILGARLLHLDGCDSEAALKAARLARSAGIPVVADIDELYGPQTEELLKRADYVIV